MRAPPQRPRFVALGFVGFVGFVAFLGFDVFAFVVFVAFAFVVFGFVALAFGLDVARFELDARAFAVFDGALRVSGGGNHPTPNANTRSIHASSGGRGYRVPPTKCGNMLRQRAAKSPTGGVLKSSL